MSFFWSPQESNCLFASKSSLKLRRNEGTIVFLSRNHRLIVAPRKFDVLKTNIYLRSEASRANMLVLRTSNSKGRLSDRYM